MQGDFARQMPAASAGLRARPAWWQRLHLDVQLLLMLLLVSGAGLFVLYSASDRSTATVTRQAAYFGIAFVAMFVAAQLEPRFYRRCAPYAYAFGVVLLLAVLAYGTGAKGAQRWLSVPGLPRFQPSELMKLAVPMMAAAYLAGRAVPPNWRDVLVVLAIVLLPAALISMQPDLGTSLLVATAGLFALYFAGLRWRYIGAALLLAIASFYPAWLFLLHDYQKQRIITLLNPESDKLGAGWNIIQSKTAIGSGGWRGKGWLNGTQSHLDFLPEGHTDFIIAVLAEEHGLRGVLVLLGLYLLLIGRGLAIALAAQDNFSRLLAASITGTFFVYVFVNMGMVSGLLPVVGVPLPLISQGGTALITLLAGFGVLMAIGTEQKKISR